MHDPEKQTHVMTTPHEQVLLFPPAQLRQRPLQNNQNGGLGLSLPEVARGGLGLGCEGLHSVLGDEQRVLELRGALAVLGGCSPLVLPHHILGDTLVDHGLDGEHVSLRHHAVVLLVFVVQYRRVRVEGFADTVTAEVAGTGVAFCLCDLFDDTADVGVWDAWLADGNGGLPRFVCGLDQPLRLVIHLSNTERFAAVPVVTV
mmetsp:Transcript_12520/g.24244  ORF Transcript_12520/g.24244 Transcript_12520/m.24244 type:complete len:202 (-) Transcript_12520:634-1239(-)